MEILELYWCVVSTILSFVFCFGPFLMPETDISA
jgi:hypothetical protein